MKITENKMTKEPAYRFSGYTDAWEQCKLETVAAEIGDGLHGTPKYTESGEVFFINGNNLNNNKIVINSETKRVSVDQLSNDDKKLMSSSILMSINGTIGTLARYDSEKIMLGKSVAYINPESVDREFLYFQFQHSSLQSYFLANVTGTTIKNLGLKVIREAILSIPSFKEQEKIGKHFKHLDDLIALHQRKLDSLKEQKKTYLQKLFPRNGETIPEIRLHGFEGEWEKANLGDFLKEYNEKSVKENQYDVLSSTNNGIEKRSGRVSGESNIGYKILKKEMIVLSPQNLWLGNINYNSEYDIGLVSPSYKIYDLQNIDKLFMSVLIRHPYMYYEYGQASVQGASIVRRNLDLELFKTIQILVPTLSEQTAIGNFFQTLDRSIAQHQTKLDKLKESKQTLLKKMFI